MRIVSAGKGKGALHLKCWNVRGLQVRQVTPEDFAHLQELKRARRLARPLGGDYR